MENIQPITPELETKDQSQQAQVDVCPYCNAKIGPALNFCPVCGKRLKDEPLTIGKQISVYLISMLLPPLGLWPAIRYLSHRDHKAKVVGATALALTAISIVVTVFLSISIIGSSLRSASSQFNQLQNLQY